MKNKLTRSAGKRTNNIAADCSFPVYFFPQQAVNYCNNKKIEEFFNAVGVKVRKRIPIGSGLGGGSSNAATFLMMANSELKLGLSSAELARIGCPVGADVSFFTSGLSSANVSGIGEIVEEFHDDIPEIKLIMPDISCSTVGVYKKFRESFYKEADKKEIEELRGKTSKELLLTLSPMYANDLYEPALSLYPELFKHGGEDIFFSGSGSTFFKVV